MEVIIKTNIIFGRIGVFYLFSVISCCFSCGNNNVTMFQNMLGLEVSFCNKNTKDVTLQEEVAFVPDTSVNNLLFLENSVTSILKNTWSYLITSKEDFPYVYVKNINKEQCLKLIFFSGGMKNCFSRFEIAYVSDYIDSKVYPDTSFEYFYTESGIYLGVSKEQLVEIKGKNYVETSDGKSTLLVYTLDDYDNSTFLKKYNMPIYTAKYWLKDDKIIKFSYGFEYP